MLFNVSEKDFFEDNPHARIMKEFSGATSAQLKFVALFADWLSPYRKLAPAERRERCLMAAGYKAKGINFAKDGDDILKGKNEDVERYIIAYKDIQGIGSEELSLGAIKAAEDNIRDRLNNLDETTTAKDISELAKSLTLLAKERRILEDLIQEKLGVDVLRELNGDASDDDDSAWDRFGQ